MVGKHRAFLHLRKAGQGIGYISSSFVQTTGEKSKKNFYRETLLGRRTSSSWGSFLTLLGNDELGWSLCMQRTWGEQDLLSCLETILVNIYCNMKTLMGLVRTIKILTLTYRAATGEMISCKKIKCQIKIVWIDWNGMNWIELDGMMLGWVLLGWIELDWGLVRSWPSRRSSATRRRRWHRHHSRPSPVQELLETALISSTLNQPLLWKAGNSSSLTIITTNTTNTITTITNTITTIIMMTLKQASLSSPVWKGAGSPSLFWFAVEIAIIVANSSPDTWWSGINHVGAKTKMVVFFRGQVIAEDRLVMEGKNLSIAISISSLEALPAEPVDLLVALRGSVANLHKNFWIYSFF